MQTSDLNVLLLTKENSSSLLEIYTYKNSFLKYAVICRVDEVFTYFLIAFRSEFVVVNFKVDEQAISTRKTGVMQYSYILKQA